MPKRCLAVGDIHGCITQLDAMLDRIAPTTDDRLIFVGDLVDRGPNVAEVLRRVITLSKQFDVTVIKGNHEQLMLDARTSHEKYTDWLKNDGNATLRSYGGVRGKLADVPREHWHFLETGLVDYLETDSHIFVHANAYPDLPMNEQPDYMLRWERCDNIAAHQSGKVIVCGHTPQKSGRPLNKGYAVCIDTHVCGSHGYLTCLDTNSGYLWQADSTGRVQKSHLSDSEND